MSIHFFPASMHTHGRVVAPRLLDDLHLSVRRWDTHPRPPPFPATTHSHTQHCRSTRPPVTHVCPQLSAAWRFRAVAAQHSTAVLRPSSDRAQSRDMRRKPVTALGPGARGAAMSGCRQGGPAAPPLPTSNMWAPPGGGRQAERLGAASQAARRSDEHGACRSDAVSCCAEMGAPRTCAVPSRARAAPLPCTRRAMVRSSEWSGAWTLRRRRRATCSSNVAFGDFAVVQGHAT